MQRHTYYNRKVEQRRTLPGQLLGQYISSSLFHNLRYCGVITTVTPPPSLSLSVSLSLHIYTMRRPHQCDSRRLEQPRKRSISICPPATASLLCICIVVCICPPLSCCIVLPVTSDRKLHQSSSHHRSVLYRRSIPKLSTPHRVAPHHQPAATH